MAELSELANQADIGNAAYIAREQARFLAQNRGQILTGGELGNGVFSYFVVARPDVPQPLVVREAGAALYLIFPGAIPDAMPGRLVPLLVQLVDLFVRAGDRDRSLFDLRQRLPSGLRELFEIIAREVERDVYARGFVA